MLSIRTVWITRHADAPPAFDVYPQPVAGNSAAEEPLYLTNDPLAFEDLLPAGKARVADVMAVHALA